MKNKLVMIIIFILSIKCNVYGITNKESQKVIDNFKKINFKNDPLSKYPTKPGQILVTTDFYKKVLPIGHAAIVIDKNYLYEATSKGVVRGANNWYKTKRKTFGLSIKNLNTKQQNMIVSYAYKNLKKKYNFNYFNTKTRSKFYCSHLVWAALYDQFKINVDTYLFNKAGTKTAAIHPVELILSNKTKTIYKHANK